MSENTRPRVSLKSDIVGTPFRVRTTHTSIRTASGTAETPVTVVRRANTILLLGSNANQRTPRTRFLAAHTTIKAAVAIPRPKTCDPAATPGPHELVGDHAKSD